MFNINLINITFPVYNEEKVLEQKIKKFYNFLKNNKKFKYKFEIIISDNKSTDRTKIIGKKLEKKYNEIKYLRVERKSRNYAIKKSWLSSKAEIVSYMDIDLSTDLKYFIPMINMLIEEKYELVVGNRLGKNSKVLNRNLKREILSRGYNLLLRIIFFHKIKDHQCGFKGMYKSSFVDLNKNIKDIKEEIWFFDTELILRAVRNKMKIGEIDVKWTDDLDSSVNVIKAIIEDLKGIYRVKKDFIKN